MHGGGPLQGVVLGPAGRGLEERVHDDGKAWHKTAVEVNHAAKTPHLKDCRGGGEINHRLDFLGQRGRAGSGNLLTQKGEGVHSKEALLCVDDHAKLLQPVEELGDVVDVLVQGGRSHQDIIQINKAKGEITNHTIHQPLECLGRIFQAEGGTDKLETAKGGGDGGLGDVLGVHWDLMVAPDKVHLGKDGATGQEMGGI